MRSRRTSNQSGVKRRRTREQRVGVVARYVESGLVQRDFAREEGIGVSTLQLWLRQSRKEVGNAGPRAHRPRGGAEQSKSLRLLEVELGGSAGKAQPETARPRSYEVELRGGTRLRFAGGFNEIEVRQLLALMAEVD